MSIKPQKQKPSVQIEEGTHLARCIGMIHLGTSEYTYQGQKGRSNKIRITFEFPTETHVWKEGEEAKPFVVSSEYSLSFGTKSKLKPLLESWRGKKFTDEEIDEFDMTKLVGVPAMVSVIHNDKGYATISSITKVPKGLECPPQVNKSTVLDYDENWSDELFMTLPTFIQDKIRESDEYKALKGSIMGMNEEEARGIVDSIPF